MLWGSLVAWLTLRPLTGFALAIHPVVPWTCLVCGGAGITDLLLNLLLFTPLGLLGHRLGWSLTRCLGLALLCTLTIELTQYFLIIGRDGTLSDVVTNTLGGGAGWLIARALATPPTRATQRRRLTLLLTTHALIWFGSGALLRPDLPTSAQWFGGVQAPAGGTARLGNTSLTGDSNAVIPPNARAATLRFTLPTAPPPTSQWIGADLHDRQGQSWAYGRHGNGWGQLWLRQHASSRGFRTSRWSVAVDTGLPIREVAWHWSDRGIVAEMTDAEGAILLRQASHLSVAMGWTLVQPFGDRVPLGRSPWTLLWLVGWFAWLGWLAAPLGRTTALLATAIALGALLGAATWMGWPLTWQEVAAAVVGVGAGVVVRGLFQRVRG